MPPHSPTRAASDWLAPLLAVLAVQTASTVLARLAPTIAPALAPHIGWPATSIGYLASLITVGSVLFLLLGVPLMRRCGSMRSLQLGLLLGAAGALLMVLPSPAAALAACLLIGLSYGPSSSAGSDVLHRYAPPSHHNLVFSIKQAGVPLGAAIAGVTLPIATEWYGIAGAAGLSMAAALLTVLAVQPVRGRVDAERDRGQPLGWRAFASVSNLTTPVRALVRLPMLRRMGTTGGCLAISQGVWFAYFVTYLVTELAWSLTAAGALFALMQAVSALGRPLLGWVSDRLGSGITVLRGATLASAASTFALALTTPAWPPWTLVVLALIAGMTVSSWNGVQVAQVARLAPPGQVGETAAGATLLVFVGYIVGPSVFGLIVAATGSYAIALSVTGLVTLSALPVLSKR